MSSKPLIICTKNGLCNKLRVLFSWWEYAKTVDRGLIVYWYDHTDLRKHLGGACAGHFYDVFEPIGGAPVLDDDTVVTELDYKGCHPHPDFDPAKQFIYTDLTLRPYLREQVNTNVTEIGDDFIAVHVRRSDFVKAIAKRRGIYKSDEQFFSEIDQFEEHRWIYLATDNEETQSIFMARYPDRLMVQSRIKQNDDRHRQTGIEGAVIDLYTCIEAADFIGTPESTFTEFIQQHRVG